MATAFSASVASAADTVKPSVPAALTASISSTSQIGLSWAASTDDVGVTGYDIYRNGTWIALVTTTGYTDVGLASNTAYAYTVAARDAANNVSAQSASVSASTWPASPTALAGTASSENQINLTWSQTIGTVGIASYKVYRGGTLIAQPSGKSYSDTGLSPGTTYAYQVSAVATGGIESAQTAAMNVKTLDLAPPSTPTGLTATAASSTQVNLSWAAATDNVAVTGYNVYRNGTFIVKVTTLTYSNTGLGANTTYTYTISAVDAAGNASPQTAAVAVTTKAVIAAAPVLASATPGISQVILTWGAVAGATGYSVKFGTVSGTYGTTRNAGNVTTFPVTGLVNGQAYYFVVNALNTGGTSPDSNEMSAVPTGIQINNVHAALSVINPNGHSNYALTSLQYDLSKAGFVTIKLYNAAGTLVKTLLNNGNQAAGSQSVNWDGTNDAGAVLADGIYTFKIDANVSAAEVAAQQTGAITIDTAFMTRTKPADNATVTGVTQFQWVPSSRVTFTDSCGGLFYRLKGTQAWEYNATSSIKQPDNSCTNDWDTSQVPNGQYEVKMQVGIYYTNEWHLEETYPYGTFNIGNNLQINNVTADPAINLNGVSDYRASNIQFMLTKNSAVTIRISNAAGATVRTLIDNVNQASGSHAWPWDGKNDAGMALPDGAYTYKIDARIGTTEVAAQKTGTILIDSAFMTRVKPADNATLKGTTQFQWKPSSMVTAIQSCGLFFYRIKGMPDWVNSGGNGTKQLDNSCTFDWDTTVISNGQYEVKMQVGIMYSNAQHFEETYPYGTFNIVNSFAINNVAVDPVFSPNGDGVYDTAAIQYVLPKAASVTVKIFDAAGTSVRNMLVNVLQQAGPQVVVWDGKNAGGVVPADGVYTYKIDAQVSATEVAAQKTGTVILDNGYMKRSAPADNATLTGVASFRWAPSKLVTGTTACYAFLYRLKGTTDWLPSGNGALQPDKSCTYDWDTNGVGNGQYEVRMDALIMYGGTGHVENTFPYGTFNVANAGKPHFIDNPWFSPNADGIKDGVTFFANFGQIGNWTVTIKDAGGVVVKTFSGSGQVLAQKWTGVNASGAIVADAVYSYQVTALSTAGVSLLNEAGSVTVDKTAPTVVITAPTPSQEITGNFVPIAGNADDINFLPEATTLSYGVGTAPVAWNIIANNIPASAAPATFLYWDTTKLKTGSYALKFSTTDRAGNTRSVVVPVSVYNVSCLSYSSSPAFVSPDGDGNADVLNFAADLSMTLNWTIRIVNSSGTVVRTLTGTGASIITTWNGKNSSGVVVADGIYDYEIVLLDPARSVTASVNGRIMVDSVPPIASITAPVQSQTITGVFTVLGSASDNNLRNYVLEYSPADFSGWTTLEVSGDRITNGALGAFDTFKVPDGAYILRLTVEDMANRVSTTSVGIQVHNMTISNVSASRRFIDPRAGQQSTISFTLSEPAAVKIDLYQAISQYNVATRVFARTLVSNFAGVSGVNQVTWDGKDGSGAVLPNGVYAYVISSTGAAAKGLYDPDYVTGTVAISNATVTPANFNPQKGESATVSYTLAQPAYVTLKIGIVDTTKIILEANRVLLNFEPRDAAANTETWDGKDNNGNLLAGTLYSAYGWATLLPDNGIAVRDTSSLTISFVKTNAYAIYPIYGGSTEIKYTISKAAQVSVSIKDPTGTSVIRTLAVNDSQAAGTYALTWNGRDDSGRVVGTPGDYKAIVSARDSATGVVIAKEGTVTVWR